MSNTEALIIDTYETYHLTADEIADRLQLDQQLVERVLKHYEADLEQFGQQ